MSQVTLKDLTADLLDLVSRMIHPTSVKILRATCSSGELGTMAPLVIYQDDRYIAAMKIQRFWNNKRIPDENNDYWSQIPWRDLPEDHPIHTQYRRLLIAHYPLKYVHSMTKQLAKLRDLELDEERCGTVTYFASLVRTSNNDVLADLGW